MNRIALRRPCRVWAALLLIGTLPACWTVTDRTPSTPAPSGEVGTGSASASASPASTPGSSSRSEQQVDVGPLRMTAEGDAARGTIELVVTNTGARPVRGVELAGAGVDEAVVSGATCTPDGPRFTCRLGTLEPGQSVPLTIAPGPGDDLRTSLRLHADPADVGTGEARLDMRLDASG